MTEARPLPKRRRFVVGALSCLVIAAAAYYVIYLMPLPFVQSWWAADNFDYYDRVHKRHRIADGFILSGRLTGKSREEIVALIGEPPPTNSFSEWDMVYVLGIERGFIAVDSEWLVIRLDDSDIVMEAAIVHD